MDTILLAANTWDLTLDAGGNIALATKPYAPAQDAASACRLFQGELWYNTTVGIPYLQRILGQFPVASFIKAQLSAASESVPDIASATTFITGFARRALGAQVKLTLSDGSTATIGTASLQGPVPWYVTAVSPAAAGSLEGGP
jgi:hypothetical protein